MPLYKISELDSNTKIYVWKITETYDELFEEVILNDRTFARLQGMKSEVHQRAFLSVRKLLQEAGYSDLDLYYDEFGKPHLKDETHISITHSFDFSALILSDKKVGIDIEYRREKIILIADKFINFNESEFLDRQNAEDYISKLTVIWGVKEAIFKIRNEKGISFKDHIFISPFEMKKNKTEALLTFGNLNKKFPVFFEEIEDYTLVYTLEN